MAACESCCSDCDTVFSVMKGGAVADVVEMGGGVVSGLFNEP